MEYMQQSSFFLAARGTLTCVHEIWAGWETPRGLLAMVCAAAGARVMSVSLCCHVCAAAKFQAQQSRQAEGGEQQGSGSPRLSAQQRLSSLGGAAAMSAAAPSDVTGICGTGYYISVSGLAPLPVQACCPVCAADDTTLSGAEAALVMPSPLSCCAVCTVVLLCHKTICASPSEHDLLPCISVCCHFTAAGDCQRLGKLR